MTVFYMCSQSIKKKYPDFSGVELEGSYVDGRKRGERRLIE